MMGSWWGATSPYTPVPALHFVQSNLEKKCGGEAMAAQYLNTKKIHKLSMHLLFPKVGRLWILRSTAPLLSAYSDKIHSYLLLV